MYVDLFDRWIIQLAVNSYLRVPNTQWGFPDDSVVKNLPAVAEDSGLIPGLGRSPGEGNNNPLQFSCFGNPMDRGAWQATVHGVTKSQRHDLQLNNNKTPC